MSGTLYFVRHGRTLFNERHIIQGWVDSPLTPEGEEQASRVGRYFAQCGVTFDHAYASLVARTHQTLERITDMPFERERGLMEWSFGAFEGERTYLMPAWPWGDFFVPFGGEGQLAFRDRIVSTLTQIMQRTGHRSVLVVAMAPRAASSSRRCATAVWRTSTWTFPATARWRGTALTVRPSGCKRSWSRMPCDGSSGSSRGC